MIKWTFFLCLAVLLVSCNSLLRSKPSGLLSESQMTDLLVDMHLTEATVRAANDSISRLNDTTDLRIRFAEVFRENDVTPDDFNKSLRYYMEQIDELDKIYSEVISRLTLLETNLQQLANKKPYAFGETEKSPVDTASLKNPWYRSLVKPFHTRQPDYFDPLIFRHK